MKVGRQEMASADTPKENTQSEPPQMEQPYWAPQGSAAIVVAAVPGRDSRFGLAGVGHVLLYHSTRFFRAHNSPVGHYSRLEHRWKSFSEAEGAADRISIFAMPSCRRRLVGVTESSLFFSVKITPLISGNYEGEIAHVVRIAASKEPESHEAACAGTWIAGARHSHLHHQPNTKERRIKTLHCHLPYARTPCTIGLPA